MDFSDNDYKVATLIKNLHYCYRNPQVVVFPTFSVSLENLKHTNTKHRETIYSSKGRVIIVIYIIDSFLRMVK